ncbi:acetylglutamate synthase [Lasallia pustulata]|uniref:Amino-acid acetyltransferase, mitochondrial n=1 Tax=Lasallia pustulata TaxID=136370 RepID=A0A1W5DCQ8_9LECA|nr:acetylglutamate synthase [Lasallia pustulata]
MPSLRTGLVREPALTAAQDLFLDVLSSTATKREARSYLSKFLPPKPRPQPPATFTPQQTRNDDRLDRSGVNLGKFYLPVTAVDESPVFSQAPVQKPFINEAVEPLHVALVIIREPQSLADATLENVGRTLTQLSRLGFSCVVVVGCKREVGARHQRGKTFDWKKTVVEQADRVAAGIEHHGQQVRRLDSLIGVSKIGDQLLPSVELRGRAFVTHREGLLGPLRRGLITVIAPVGYTSDTQTVIPVDADEVALALTREFAGIFGTTSPHEDPVKVAERFQALQKEVSLDRIIVLDPLGGIPSIDRPNGSHVFINLEQEYEDIKKELLQSKGNDLTSTTFHASSQMPKTPFSTLADSNPISKFVDEEVATLPSDNGGQRKMLEEVSASSGKDSHLRNLKLLRNTLALLPSSSSALLTTPEEAANSGKRSTSLSPSPGVGTRTQRNPLIHNLLTDKPIFSSSLPTARLGPTPVRSPHLAAQISPTTFVKRGMPVTIVPNPRTEPWIPPGPSSTPTLQLTDPRIDLPRLIHLIEDSFGRELDVQHYLNRIGNRIAGVIIAGEYEGGALLTWETPPALSTSTGDLGPHDRLVPYLDKFAVLKRSQGAGGVADIVFTSMVRDCFPGGVCWRSRRDNPVNKWYFERAKGTWKMPDSNWTMFWTTEGVMQKGQTFMDYEGVCRAVVPSWAGNSNAVD